MILSKALVSSERGDLLFFQISQWRMGVIIMQFHFLDRDSETLHLEHRKEGFKQVLVREVTTVFRHESR